MPNPFPGMNPYLEERSDWRGLHTLMIGQTTRALNAVLPSNYVAAVEVRCVISHYSRLMEPDVAVLEARSTALPHSRGNLGVLERPQTAAASLPHSFDAPWIVSVEPLEERQAFINIMRVEKGKFRNAEMVTSIEILSPTNKNTRDDGYERYRGKQEQVLSSRANLLEIDLLRAGTHTVAVPEASLPPDAVWNYIVCLHRGARPFEYAVWLNSLRDRLPRVEVPLAQGDPSVVLDLQSVIDVSYDAGAYDRQIDYALEADPPLQGEDALWTDALLRERGLRS